MSSGAQRRLLADLRELERQPLPMVSARIPRAIQKARAFSCHTCPHVPGCPWPPVVTKLEINQLPKKEADIIREELDVLGIDISLIWNNRKNEPSEINTNLDLLSYTAYSVDSVRQTVMGDAFTHWLPLCNEGRFRPEMAFETLAKLCNTMVVNVMAERTHASLKALSGYCAFQRLILHFARQYPSLVKAANSMVDMFVENESYRTKEVVKALGEFLPLLTITEKSWKDIALAYLYESFDRNVRWMLQKFPMLATTQPDPIVDEKRCALTFESSIVSLRLLLFHVYFLENVGRPEGMSLEDIAQGYDAMYGMPSAKMKESLQEACKQIQQVASWDEYFARIGVKAPTRDELTEWLRQSVANSARKGYHDPRKYSRYLTEKYGEDECELVDGQTRPRR
ncbi:ubiquitin carrier protein [Acanthamoeba castellanii str. Neff]|uniref:Ubiquitin carrier protein n=1 Tax=Acanthamoeba castellanii (strain ATCC 30010 / Neff) TaxID=1257118 RepID=L8HHE5_ACACF|nr:ubiquitin carrier protein [Acanthamoeba castellanii str. Neff]ELR24103.1 ubiquitin carrier protein [Acanthamoeba castellanii str. Neff]